jgi:hypothetical protein
VITLPGAEQLDGKLSATAENSNVSSKMSLCRPLLKSEVGYCLRLANDQGWHIIPTEGTRVWVEKLAWILELKTPESTEYPKLIFVLRQTDEKRNSEPVCQLHPKIKEWLPSNGWNASDLLYLRIWSHTEVPDVICELGPQEGKKENFHSMRMALQPVYQRTQDSGGLPLHGQYVPVKAIFFLEQSETDKVVPMGRGQSAVLMYQSAAEVCHRNWMKVNREEVSTFRKKLFENSCRLAKAIPAFRLRVSLQGRFWEKIEEVLP